MHGVCDMVRGALSISTASFLNEDEQAFTGVETRARDRLYVSGVTGRPPTWRRSDWDVAAVNGDRQGRRGGSGLLEVFVVFEDKYYTEVGIGEMFQAYRPADVLRKLETIAKPL